MMGLFWRDRSSYGCCWSLKSFERSNIAYPKDLNAWLGSAFLSETGQPAGCWRQPMTLPPFTAPNLIIKTGCSFNRFAEPMSDRFQGHPPPACSAALLGKADVHRTRWPAALSDSPEQPPSGTRPVIADVPTVRRFAGFGLEIGHGLQFRRSLKAATAQAALLPTPRSTAAPWQRRGPPCSKQPDCWSFQATERDFRCRDRLVLRRPQAPREPVRRHPRSRGCRFQSLRSPCSWPEWQPSKLTFSIELDSPTCRKHFALEPAIARAR